MARSRSMTASLSRLLSDVRVPVYVLDDQRTLIYLNAACEEWLDVAGELIVGRRCNYVSSATDDRLAAIVSALCPPPPAMAGQCQGSELAVPTADGQFSTRRAIFIPLGDDPIECEGVIVVVAADESSSKPQTTAASPAEFEKLHHELQQFRRTQSGRYQLDRLIGKSAAMLRVKRQAEMAIASGARTVVIGPPGSGREHIARTIHFAGDDAHAPTLMPLSCGLLDAELLQTSITAFARHAADNRSSRPPTILLCDVDLLSESGQTELIGFLSLPGFQLHVLSTARRSLLKVAGEGKFRPELAYALSTLEIELPPLAARRRDIPLLAQMFVEEYNATGANQLAGLDSAALDVLCEYAWDENVDELRDVVRQACEAASGAQIFLDDLPEALVHAAEVVPSTNRNEAPIVLDDLLADVENELIRRAMRLAKGNKTKAAELLGISRPRLHRRWEEMEGNNRAPE